MVKICAIQKCVFLIISLDYICPSMALTPAKFESENKNSEIVNVVKVSKNIKHVGYFGKVGDFASRPPKVRIFGLADHNAIKIRGQF